MWPHLPPTLDRLLLVDGRTDEQFYAGGKHPKAARAGRIPSAVLMDQDKAYSSENNRLKSSNELASIYNDLGDKTIVSYCNTGHWAATNWFVMSEILGQKNVKLYDGSMVEWTANTDLPLDTSGKSNMQKIKDMFSGLWDNTNAVSWKPQAKTEVAFLAF